jgi:hypothetical protein
MTIRAVLREGVIQPTEPLPPDWRDGQELVVEEPKRAVANEEIELWERQVEAAAEQIPAEEHDRFLRALDEIEQESKEAIRKQWEQP